MVTGETSNRRGRKMYRRLAYVIYSRENSGRKRQDEKLEGDCVGRWDCGILRNYNNDIDNNNNILKPAEVRTNSPRDLVTHRDSSHVRLR